MFPSRQAALAPKSASLALELIETIRVLIASMALSPPAMLVSGLLEMPFRQAFSLEFYYVWGS